ncbi:nucleotidyltransferase family protein [Thauera sp.]|uniref:nucleotidyltransferase family protein n=1 Tax=Thauera sp. TaxID=1905334 RepID=UPI0039E59759
MDALACQHRPASSSPTVIVLAAGRGERFLASGGVVHKLDTLLEGESVLEHVLGAVKASGLPWHLVRPAGGTAGMGDSIALGVKATAIAAGWLILPGDLPLIRAESLRHVALALNEHPVVVPHHRYRRGHPVGFRRECLAALRTLTGDAGAASVVRTYRDRGRVLDLSLDDPGIAFDVDSLDDLREAERLLRMQAQMVG